LAIFYSFFLAFLLFIITIILCFFLNQHFIRNSKKIVKKLSVYGIANIIKGSGVLEIEDTNYDNSSTNNDLNNDAIDRNNLPVANSPNSPSSEIPTRNINTGNKKLRNKKGENKTNHFLNSIIIDADDDEYDDNSVDIIDEIKSTNIFNSSNSDDSIKKCFSSYQIKLLKIMLERE
jgi:hypothetical protein